MKMDPSSLSECKLYDTLLKHVIPPEQLEKHDYPIQDLREPGRRKVPTDAYGRVKQTTEGFVNPYTCERCKEVYHVDLATGLPISGQCKNHPGKPRRVGYLGERRYSCCEKSSYQPGCTIKPYHVNLGESLSSNYAGFVETRDKPEKDPNKHGVYALDCEMCYTTHGLELTQVTVISYKKEVVYEKLVKPTNQILDYNTEFTGLKAGGLDHVETSLADVQRDLLDMFSSKTILIGHSLNHDMEALKIFHKRFVDTAVLYPHRRGPRFKIGLKTVTRVELKRVIQAGRSHDSKEDAIAALDLVMLKVMRSS